MTWRIDDHVPCVVYGLCSDDGAIRYVGQTTRSAEVRLRKHRENARLGVVTPMYHWMRREVAEGRAVCAVVLERDAEYGAAERRWIAKLRADGARLLNLTNGGYQGTDEMRAKRSASVKAWWAARKEAIHVEG